LPEASFRNYLRLLQECLKSSKIVAIWLIVFYALKDSSLDIVTAALLATVISLVLFLGETFEKMQRAEKTK